MPPTLKQQPNKDASAADGASGIFPAGRFAALVAAALRPAEAGAAWAAYRAALGEGVPNEGETRLYPLVAHNLKATGADALDAPLVSATRRAMALSMMGLDAAETVNRLFAERGIPVVFTKGLALQIAEYRAPTLRTFADIDCCIRVEDIPAVVRLATDEGWQNPMNLIPETDDIIAAHAEMTFRLPSGIELDVHWVPRRAFAYRPELVAQFFDTTRQIEWRGQTWRVPSATWQLIETIDHGLEANTVTPIRWIPDAVRLIENPAHAIDWKGVEATANAARLRLVFQTALTQLSQVTDRIPDATLKRLKGPSGPLQALELRARLHKHPTLSHRFKREVLHYLLRAPGPFALRLIRLPGFLIRGAGRSPQASDFVRRVWQHLGAR